MAIECRTFSLDTGVDDALSKVAARFSIKKSQVVNELLKQALPDLLQAEKFLISSFASIAHNQRGKPPGNQDQA